MATFTKATKKRAKLRLAFVGPAGAGKTYSALAVATGLGGRVALMDTEHGSASKYADLFEFDAFEPDSFHPQVFIDAIATAEREGYDVLVIDSLSHAWMGKDGALEIVDRAAAKNHGNSFAGWRDVTPLHNRLVDAMLAAKLHLIVTMRSKTEWVMEQVQRGGKTITVPKRVGMQPVQRDGLEFEFDVVGDIDTEGNFVVSKTRCPKLNGVSVHHPGKPLADTLLEWLTDGAPNPQHETADDDTLGRIADLLGAREVPKEQHDKIKARILGKGMSVAEADGTIAWLNRQPEKSA